MNIKTLKNKLSVSGWFYDKKKFINRWVVVSFLIAFGVMFTFVDITLNRNALIRNFKANISTVIKDLNEIGIDLAYEQLEFDNVFIFPLLKIKNLSLYNLKGENLWQIKIDEVSASPSLWGWKKVKFVNDGNISFQIDEKKWQISSGEAEFIFTLGKKYRFKSAEMYLKNINIKDFAKIKKITLAFRDIENKNGNSILPMTTEAYLEVNNVAINGLLDYPLTSNIRRIYMNLNLWGNFSDKDGVLIGAENWLHGGGFIDVSSLIVSWDPLLLVGRGDIHFNEDFKPKMSLHTSSKALLNLLNDLQDKKYLERKGVFVANILLGAKAFKANEDDEYYTITTPITYRDGKLAVENITVKTF